MVPKAFRARLTRKQKARLRTTKPTLADVCDAILSRGNQTMAGRDHKYVHKKRAISERRVKGAKVILVQELDENGKMKSYFVEKK